MQRTMRTTPKVPTWALYVVPGESNSEKALAAAPTGVRAVDVRELEAYPPFLDGVPILANNKEKMAYKGTQALRPLAELKKDELKPAGVATGQRNTMGSFVDGAAIAPGAGAPADLRGGIATRVLEGRVQEQDVSAYMQQRSQVTDNAVKKAQHKADKPVPLGGDRVPPSVAAAARKAVRPPAARPPPPGTTAAGGGAVDATKL